MAFLRLTDDQLRRRDALADPALFDARVTEALKLRMEDTSRETPPSELQAIMSKTIDDVLDELSDSDGRR